MEHTKAYQEFKKNGNTKFVRYSEGAEMYHMGISKFMQMAKDAKAIYKLGQLVLVNLKIFDEYIETFHIVGHDYAIGIDSDGKMYRQDVAEENGEIEPYPIDDVIDTVCEWNYELILDADAHRNDPKDFNYQKV